MCTGERTERVTVSTTCKKTLVGEASCALVQPALELASAFAQLAFCTRARRWHPHELLCGPSPTSGGARDFGRQRDNATYCHAWWHTRAGSQPHARWQQSLCPRCATMVRRCPQEVTNSSCSYGDSMFLAERTFSQSAPAGRAQSSRNCVR